MFLCTLFRNFIFFSLLLLPSFLLAQNAATISGHIETRNGKPIKGVNVLLGNNSLGTFTNENGDYSLMGVPFGTHKLLIRAIGYETKIKIVNIQDGQQRIFNFTLQEKTYEMGEIVVNAKSKTRIINEQAYNVDAVEAERFYNSAANVSEILDRLSSVRVMQDAGLGSDLTFSLNGFSGNQVRFFLNGIPMDNYGGSFNLSTIPANMIERIEVYSGVVPIWLGSDALGGAVNIITVKNANFLDASYTYGSFNTHRASFNGAYTNLKTGFTVRGNLNYNYSDNDYEVKVEVEEDKLGNETTIRTVPRFHNRYRGAMLKVETGFVNRDFADQLLIGAIISGDDMQVQNGSTMNSVYGGVTQSNRSAVATLKYGKKNIFTENLTLKFSASYSYNERRSVDTLQGVAFNWAGERFFTPGDNTGELGGEPFDQSQYNNGINSQLNLEYAVNPRHSFALNYAFTYFDRSVHDRRNPDKIVNQFPKSLFKNILGASYQYHPNKKWNTTLFGKAYLMKAKTSKKEAYGEESLENFEVGNQNFGYGIASSYFILPKLQVKASFEHTYRLPIANEIFGNGLFVLPNAELEPEESDNFNFGANYRFGIQENHHFEVGSSFIYRNANNLIFQVVTLSSPQTSFSNLAEVRTVGVEGNLNYNYKNRLRLGANITYQNITDQAEMVYNDYAGYQENYHQGERLPNRPYLFGNGYASYQFDNVIMENSRLKLNYYLHFVEEYYLSWGSLGNENSKNVIPGQFSHDVEVIYSFHNGKYNISLECSNLTDELIYDKFYLQRPGRAFYLKLRYSF